MQKERLLSLMFLEDLSLLMTIVNNPGSWSHIYPPLKHAGMARLHSH
jgi:hypothetical protein